MIPRSMSEMPGRRPRTRRGRPFHRTGRRLSRDPSRRHSSDEVWSLVERMMNGEVEAWQVLGDLIEEGVTAGKTRFVKITRRSYKRFGKVYPAQVVEGQFAAITPNSSIVLFGVKDQYLPGGGHAKRGYVSRYRIGDTAEYDSYNLVYFGEIVGISEKRVTIDKNARYRQRHATTGELTRYPVKKAVLDIEDFSNKNWDPENLEKGARRNREWSD